MAKYTKWNNIPEDIELFEKVFNDVDQVDQLESLVEAGAPYLYPEQDSENWKETVIDKFAKSQMTQSLEMISKKHIYSKNDENDETNAIYKQHLFHALWTAIERNDEELIKTIKGMRHGPLWTNTSENIKIFEKAFNDDAHIDRLFTLLKVGAP